MDTKEKAADKVLKLGEKWFESDLIASRDKQDLKAAGNTKKLLNDLRNAFRELRSLK